MTYQELCLSICEGEGVEWDDVVSASRKRELVLTRQLCMYFGRIFFGDTMTLAQIALPFGKDHATAIHAAKTVQNLMFSDKVFRARVLHYEIKFEHQKTETGIISIKQELERNEIAHQLIMRLSEMRIIAEAYCLLSGHKLIPIEKNEDQD